MMRREDSHSQPRRQCHKNGNDDENKNTNHHAKGAAPITTMTTIAITIIDVLSTYVTRFRHSSKKQRTICACILIVSLVSLVGLWRMDSLVGYFTNNGTSSSLSKVERTAFYNFLLNKNNNNNNTKTNLWIYVDSWHEGIAGWRPSLSQILVLAKAFNATLVEPTIARSRLDRCYKKKNNNGNSNNDHNVTTTTTLFDIFNRTLITTYHSKIVTCPRYQRELERHQVTGDNQNSNNKNDIIYVDVCWDKQSKCKNAIPSSHSREYSPQLWQGLRTAMEYPNTMVVLRFHDVWQNSMTKLILPTEPTEGIQLLEGDDNDRKSSTTSIPNIAMEVAKRYLHFQDSLVDMLEGKLRQHNIVTHSVIHWRAEQAVTATKKSSFSYLDCAQAIVQARNAMMKISSHHNKKTVPTFFIMSSLSSTNNELHSWNGARKNAVNTTAPQAWEYLRKEGMMTLEETILADMTFDDSIYYVVMDLILASKAIMFSTCTERCSWPKYHICKKCNWVGNFAHLALEMRGNDRTDGSLPCWPQTAKQVAAIERIRKEHV
jgi:hypothetical protein